MRKNFIIIIYLLIFFSPLLMGIFAGISESINGINDYARITELDYKAVVVDTPNSKGKVIITERLTFDIHAASEDNLFWELWRDLPEEYIDGVKVEYKVNSVKQILDDNSYITFAESPKLYWYDSDYTKSAISQGYGPGKWYHSKGPYDDYQNFECVLFYVDGLYRETVTFEIEYEMYNAALRYRDSSELYMSLYSGDSIKYLKSLKGQILFPNSKMPKPGNYDVYTYGTNAHEFPLTESSTKNLGYHTFSFELNESQLKFKPYNEYVEFALISHGTDKHIFTQYASINDYYFKDMLPDIEKAQADYEALPEQFKSIKSFVFILVSSIAAFTVYFVFSVDKKLKNKYNFSEPTIPYDFFREIPSKLDTNFARTLVFCKHKKSGKESDEVRDGYASVLLSLVHKGYIELDRINPSRNWTPENVRIIFTNAIMRPVSSLEVTEQNIDTQNQPVVDRKPLTPSEEQYLNLILRHTTGNEIVLSSLQSKVSHDYDYTYSFVRNIKNTIKNIGVSQGYFQKAEYTQLKNSATGWSIALGIIGIIIILFVNLISYQTRLDLAFGAFFILGTGFVLSAFCLKIFSKRYILLTQFGEDEYAKWRGLYNFLNSDTLIKERTVLEVSLWEDYLIYATAFGISEKVIKALKIRCPEADISPVLRNPYFYTRSFYTTSHSFGTATRTASTTSRSGGWSGYGGGGRGGGGGRRWTLKFIYIYEEVS